MDVYANSGFWVVKDSDRSVCVGGEGWWLGAGGH